MILFSATISAEEEGEFMEQKKTEGKISYQKPELIDMMKLEARGREYCNPGTGALDGCYDGAAPGWGCYAGTDVPA